LGAAHQRLGVGRAIKWRKFFDFSSMLIGRVVARRSSCALCVKMKMATTEIAIIVMPLSPSYE
jgi:hypothetical protein